MHTKHFRESEFTCKCCGDLLLRSELLTVLELIRNKFNKPVFINSGYRCPTHNAKEGGAPTSQHTLGTAADIVVDDVHPIAVYEFLDATFPSTYGLGIYSTWIHVDVREEKARW